MMKSFGIRCLLYITIAVTAYTQTKVDLRTQSKSVDFSGLTSTKPFRTGNSLPVTCEVGEVFFKADALPGKNLYACTATNIWSLQSAGQELSLGGDVSGASGSLAVTRIQGYAIAPTSPADGQVLQWNALSGQWEPKSGSGALPEQAPNPNRFLFTDGVSPKWRSFAAGGSGALSVGQNSSETSVDVQPEVLPFLAFDNTWSGKQIFTPSVAQTLLAGSQIAPNRAVVQIRSSGGDVALAATPTIPDGSDGQWLTIVNVGTSATITLQDESALASANLRLSGGSSLALGPRESVSFFFNAALGDWIQVKGGASSLAALGDPGNNGIVARTEENTTAARTITGTPGKITVSNGDGAAGNPTLNVGSDLLDLTTPRQAHTALFGPASGVSGMPSFRRMESSDLPEGLSFLALDNIWSGKQIFTPSAAQTLLAGSQIVPNRAVVQIRSSGGNVALTGTPTIPDGSDGQWLTIVNVDTSATITLQDESALASANLRLSGGSSLALGPRESVSFFFNAALGDWIQVKGGSSGPVAALGDPGNNGIVARTEENTTVSRTITGTPGKITVSNGDGAAGNPTLNAGSDLLDLTTPRQAHTALFGPASGASGAPSFRRMETSDLPDIGRSYLTTVMPGTAANSIALVSSNRNIRMYLLPVYHKMNIQRIALNLTMAGSAGSKVRIAVYNSACDTLMFQSGEIDGSTTTPTPVVSVLPSPVTLNPGYYYVAWSATDATIRANALNTNSNYYAILNGTSNPVMADAGNSLDASNNFPATCGTLTPINAALPIIVLGQ